MQQLNGSLNHILFLYFTKKNYVFTASRKKFSHHHSKYLSLPVSLSGKINSILAKSKGFLNVCKW